MYAVQAGFFQLKDLWSGIYRMVQFSQKFVNDVLIISFGFMVL